MSDIIIEFLIRFIYIVSSILLVMCIITNSITMGIIIVIVTLFALSFCGLIYLLDNQCPHCKYDLSAYKDGKYAINYCPCCGKRIKLILYKK